AMLPKPLLQCGEFRRRDGQGDVAAELRFKRRRLEARHLDEMQLLPRRDLQPRRRPADVAGPADRSPAPRPCEEGLGLVDVTGCKGDVGQRHGLPRRVFWIVPFRPPVQAPNQYNIERFGVGWLRLSTSSTANPTDTTSGPVDQLPLRP